MICGGESRVPERNSHQSDGVLDVHCSSTPVCGARTIAAEWNLEER